VARCIDEAEKQFEQALKLAPGLAEARLRLAWLKRARNASGGDAELAAIAADPRAAVDLRQVAMLVLARHELDAGRPRDAAARLEDANELGPGNASIAIALRTLTGQAGTVSDPPNTTGVPDIWYNAPCRVLTASVRDNLASRIRRVREARP
jgi:hypothetical protein